MKSILQNFEHCYLCGNPNVETHHVIHGHGRRKLAESQGLTIKLCRQCHVMIHANYSKDLALKIMAQEKWMEVNGKTRDDFINIFGRSYV